CTVDDAVLQGGYDFAKGKRYAAAAKSLNELGLCATAGADFLASHVGKTVHFGVAKQDLRGIGREAEHMDIVLVVESAVRRCVGLGHLLGDFRRRSKTC